jgi:Rrf2 family iron-sulfur cluster assembly transcriptional regulator
MPRPFASKILLDLVKAGLLKSTRGPGGGYGLAKPAAEISLLEIREVFDGIADLEACAVGLDRCSDEAPCPLHEFFMPIRRSIRQYLEQTTLEDMAAATERKRALLGLTDG